MSELQRYYRAIFIARNGQLWSMSFRGDGMVLAKCHAEHCATCSSAPFQFYKIKSLTFIGRVPPTDNDFGVFQLQSVSKQV